LAAVRNTGRFAPLLNSPPLMWLGDISYSLYLLHWFVLFVTTEIARRLPGLDFANLPLAPSLALIAVLIAVSLALATLSFRFIEVTGRRWLRQRLDVGRPAAVVGSGA
jgi:peptidoglycan/LPS O-acetylase OafA/YrhL